MASTGLLILTSPPSHILVQLNAHLRAVTRLVSKILYIKLEPGRSEVWPPKLYELSHGDLHHLAKIIPSVYRYASSTCANMDVRVLQGFTKEPNHKDHHLKDPFDIVLTDCRIPQQNIQLYLQNQFHKDCNQIHSLDMFDDSKVTKDESNISLKLDGYDEDQHPFVTYQNVCLGGTFDRLHNGHKVLLSEAVLRCSRKLTVGVTDGDMIKHKTLWELMEPIEVRISRVKDFLRDIDPTIQYSVVPIYDPFGPAVEDASLQCIVVSEETKRGGIRVNEERQKREMSALIMHVIPLLEDPHHASVEEVKVSSSSHRMRLLGTLLQPPQPKAHLSDKPYLIGLTGGIGSGKSSIGKLLQKFGAGIIECDKLAHQTYDPGRPVYSKIVEEFGSGILNADRTINRRKLGAVIFDNKILRQRLNSLVWPETEHMMKQEIKRLSEEGFKVIVLEVPLLIEAGWANYVHQVWVAIIPEAEAVIRLKERDNISDDEARKRIHSQISNMERVANANMVFCTLWDPKYTEAQVQKAWKILESFVPD